jgi:hypothetical protein
MGKENLSLNIQFIYLHMSWYSYLYHTGCFYISHNKAFNRYRYLGLAHTQIKFLVRKKG